MKFLNEIGFSYFINKLKSMFDKKADTTYVNNKVKTDVPANAKFTDTVYTHPSNHAAGIIIESATKRFVSDVEKTRWSNKQDSLGYTPLKNTGDTITGGDLRMDGGSVNYIRPDTTGGWARGFWWSDRNLSRIGGIGVLGSGVTVSKFYVGYGKSPWINPILDIFPGHVNINGDLRKQGESVATTEDLNNKVKTPVPANAKFTDTLVDISGKADKIKDENTGDGYAFTVIDGVPYMRKEL